MIKKFLPIIVGFLAGTLFGASEKGRTMLYKATKGKLGSAA